MRGSRPATIVASVRDKGQGLPDGVIVTRLTPHPDDRGVFTEVWRAEWSTETVPVQWNVVRSGSNVIRGMHVHVIHDDYVFVAMGRAVIAVLDLRDDSPTVGVCETVVLDGNDGITIPHGVAHAFHFTEPSIHVYSVSHYFDLNDELGCRYDDPDIGIEWSHTARISDRDAGLGTLADLQVELNRRRAGGAPHIAR
jgi:dTDP-4-dehydrorhamnose 3,5-epimerase